MEVIDKKKEFIQNGATTILKHESIYSDSDWQNIRDIVFHSDLPVETVHIGDVGEPNKVDVARFVIDKEIPSFVNKKYSEPLIDILYSEHKQEFFKSFLEKENLYLRRCQLNKLEKGGFIGKHLDCDSNPDYIAAIILHFDEDFEGGEFIYYPNDNPSRVKTSKESVIISSCLIEHEVKKVEGGKRATLVFFLSENNGKNKSDKLIQMD
jgi:hypothetical protein